MIQFTGGYIEVAGTPGAAPMPVFGNSFVGGWFRRRIDTNADACLILLRGEGTTGQYIGIYTSATNDTLVLNVNGSILTTGAVLNDTVTVFTGLVLSGTQASLLWSLDTQTSGSSTTGVTISDPQINRLRFGADGFGANFDGYCEGIVAFNSVRNAQQLNSQKRFKSPVHPRDNLSLWLPMKGESLADDLLDYSGGQFATSQVGSLTLYNEAARRAWSDEA